MPNIRFNNLYQFRTEEPIPETLENRIKELFETYRIITSFSHVDLNEERYNFRDPEGYYQNERIH